MPTVAFQRTYHVAKRKDTLCDARIYFGTDDMPDGGFAMSWRHRMCLGNQPHQHRNLPVLEATPGAWGHLSCECHQPLFQAIAKEGISLTPERFCALLTEHGYVKTETLIHTSPQF